MTQTTPKQRHAARVSRTSAPAPTVRIPAPELAVATDHVGGTVSVRIAVLGAPDELRFTFRGIVPAPSIDALVPAVLIPAMLHRRPVETQRPISPRLAGALPSIQGMYEQWAPALTKITVHSPVPVPAATPIAPAARGPGVALFFSGGLDSLYTLLTCNDEITTLVRLEPFGRPVPDASRERTSRAMHAVAKSARKRLVEVETNLFALLDRWMELEKKGHLGPQMYNLELTHGAAMAAVALLLPPEIGKVYIAASDTYLDLGPWGSHPLLDPLWSTEAREIVHHGADATRIQKARRVGASELALGNLRVCKQWGAAGINCGRCEKCLHTMVNLRIAGVLGRCPAFAEPLNLRRVALLPSTYAFRSFHAENLAAARAAGTDPDLIVALERAGRRWAPGRVGLELLLGCWKLAKRVAPLRFTGGRVRWQA